MARSLTPDEIGWARHLVSHGSTLGRKPGVAQRFTWLNRLDGVLAGDRCNCGACPSIELVAADTLTAPTGQPDFVLFGGTNQMLVLLHIVDDQPAYLEGVPNDSDGAAAFPPPLTR